LRFKKDEYLSRQNKAIQSIKSSGLDALLMFAPESQYWICGYDTFGFAMFQCLILDSKGGLNLLTRSPDLRQALYTSTLSEPEIHIWNEIEGINPAEELLKLLNELDISGKIGFEGQSAGLTDFNGQLLRNTIPNLVESSNLIRSLRRIKSANEIKMHRQAAILSDDALDAAVNSTSPGAFEGDILAEMQGAVFRGGGDYAGNEFIIGSGKGALLCRYYSGRRHLDPEDQLTLEWSGAFARYHAAMMRTIIIGKPTDSQKRMHAACLEAIEACEDKIFPNALMGDVFNAHSEVFDKYGLSHARLQACGYGMGAVFNPIWVDFPMFYEGNPLKISSGQVFFLHMILMDDRTSTAMTLGHSVLVKKNGIERLSRHNLDLIYVT
tara:strand:- start:481 stop:1623 length:1143 start_codon:yes stop_codon:yes gene_type:complete